MYRTLARRYYRRLSFLRSWLTRVGEYQNLYKKRKRIASVRLHETQKRSIDAFYKTHYGKRIPYGWHRLYQSYTGVFREDYFPEILFSTRLEMMFNPMAQALVLGDKNLLPLLVEGLSDVRCPKTYLSCVGGIYLSGEGRLLSREEAVLSLYDRGWVVVKKSLGSGSGRDVRLCEVVGSVDKKSGLTIREILREMGDQFVVQEKVLPHPVLEALYPHALNTFRVCTYLVEDTVQAAPLVLKLGRGGMDVDNMHAGGLGIGVSEEGFLYEAAFSEQGERFLAHPDTGVLFSGVRVPQVPDVIQAAKALHRRIPQLQMLSLDMTIDHLGQVVVIELNTLGQSVWLSQMTTGLPFFGVHTPYMLRRMRKT